MAGFSYELRHDYCAGRLHPSPRRIMWFMGNRKLTKEEGEDSVVSSVKKRLRHRNIWKYYSCRLSAACGGSKFVVWLVYHISLSVAAAISLFVKKGQLVSNGNNIISRCYRRRNPDQEVGISNVCIDTDKKRDTITIAGNIPPNIDNLFI